MRARILSLVVLLLAAASTFVACQSSTATPSTGGLVVRGCIALPRDTCTALASIDGPYVLKGRLDGLYRDEYTCIALVENQRADATPVTLREALVRVRPADPLDPTVIASSTIAISGVLDPSSRGSAGLGFTAATLIDADTAEKLTQAAAVEKASRGVVVNLTLIGRTGDGTEVTSNEFVYPIDVCAGCTCTMPIDDYCVVIQSKPPADCLLGQDGSADCRHLGTDACKYLECEKDSNTGKSLLETARCPEKGIADGSCCDP